MSQISAEVSGAFARKGELEGHHFHTFADGSGSFTAKRNSGFSPFDHANDAIERLASKTGQQVEANFFGSDKGTLLVQLGAFTPTDINQRLMLGTTFATAVQEMQQEAAKPGQHHFIVYSDGDIGDYNNSRDAFRAFLSSRKNATVDVIVCCERPGSWMQELTTAIAGEFPGQVQVVQTHPDDKHAVFNAAEAAVTKRLSEPVNEAAAAVPAAKAASPDKKA